MNRLDTLFGTVSKNKEIAMDQDVTRSISGSTLVSGSISAVGTQQLPQDAIDRVTETVVSGSFSAPITNQGKGQTGRGQQAPSTTNKIPRIYGQVNTGAVITDAKKSGANSLLYCMVLSEMDYDRFDNFVGTGDEKAFEINEVYRNDDKCIFSSFTNAESKVITLNNLQDNSNIDIDNSNVINVYAWAGNSYANAQIFPEYAPASSSRKNAYDIMPDWTSSNTMEDLVFAIVRVDKLDTSIDANANTTIGNFGTFRFEVTTKGEENQSNPSSTYKELTNPAYALLDYLTSSRYGAGFSNADIDLDSIESWADYCAETTYFASDTLLPGGTSVSFPSPPGGSGYVNAQDRFRIDGFINPQDSVGSNIEKICNAGQATFTYDQRTGKYKVFVNKKITTSEKANAFVFNKDNIVSSIVFNSTDIYSMFNECEVKFPNHIAQDLEDTVVVSTPTAKRLQNEPENRMSIALTTVTDRPRAALIGNSTLSASRVGNLVKFTGDHSTLQVDTGDFVKITDQIKGWEEKVFRVLRINERTRMGSVTCEFDCIEYSDEPFDENIYYDTVDEAAATGFGTTENWLDSATLSFVDTYANTTPAIGNVYVVDNPASGSGNIVNPVNGAVLGSDTVSNLATDSSLPVGFDSANESWIAIKAPKGSDPTFDDAYVDLIGQDGITTTRAYTTTTNKTTAPTGATSFVYTKINKITSGTYKIRVRYEETDKIPARVSQTYETGNITIVDRTPTGNTLFDTYGTGTDLVQTLSATETTTALFYNLHTPIQHSFANAATGEFVFSTNVTVNYSTLAPTSNLAFTPTGNITFVNDKNVVSKVYQFNSGGFFHAGQDQINASGLNGNPENITGSFRTDAEFYGLNKDWYASRANVVMQAISSGSGNNITFDNIDYRIYNRDNLYRNIGA